MPTKLQCFHINIKQCYNVYYFGGEGGLSYQIGIDILSSIQTDRLRWNKWEHQSWDHHFGAAIQMQKYNDSTELLSLPSVIPPLTE